MTKEKELDWIAKEIKSTLNDLENTFWNAFVKPSEFGFEDENRDPYDFEKVDNEEWLFQGTRRLYYKICFFLELKSVSEYCNIFRAEFGSMIDDQQKVLDSYGGRYNESEPSMIIHDRFRDFLSAFVEFDYEFSRKVETNKLKLILENTNAIVARTRTNVTNETSIYIPVRWVTEVIYPSTRSLGKARFISKDWTYHPDILVPEISSAVEYKLIKPGESLQKYLDQIKTDSDNYVGDPEYKYFYAVIYFKDKTSMNNEGIKQAIKEKQFPENWSIMAL